MDTSPPDPKRLRTEPSWQQSSSTSQHSSHPRHNNNPPTLPPPRTNSHPSSYSAYSVRHPEPHSSAPPTPVHHQAPAQPHPDVRRHHDHDSYGPMQGGHYQQQHPHPPVSPAHAHGIYQSSYQPREPVKQEPMEDARRPSSTGHATEPAGPVPPMNSNHHTLPPPPQAHPPPPPPSYHDAQPRHMSYDNGPAAPPTSTSYRAPSFAPQSAPMTQQPSSYEHHGAYHAADTLYVYPSSTAPTKKKNTRASQACDQCRQLKAKCDETKPCKTCRDKGLECRYRDPVPKATDKAQADILEGLSAIQSTLGLFATRLAKLEEGSYRSCASHPPKLEHRLDLDIKASQHSPCLNDSTVDTFYHRSSQELIRQPSEAVRPLPMMAEDEMEKEPGPVVPPGEPAIPINHTTHAGLLLGWPSIRDLTKQHLDAEDIKFIHEYPISKEQNRGSLILYGQGEASHYSFSRIREHVDHGSLDMADDVSDIASPSPAADFGQWGSMDTVDSYRGSSVLAPDGNPDFCEQKVWTYVASFKENILNMHPIIQPKMLDTWVRHFLDTLPISNARTSRNFAVHNVHTPEAAGSKRKRSPGPDGVDGPPPSGLVRYGRPERSIHSALILTVLALGKICLSRDKVPDAVIPGSTSDAMAHGSPAIRNGLPQSPGQGSPPSYPNMSQSAHTSPKDYIDRGSQSRRPSVHGSTGLRSSGSQLKKNYDVIPGLEYFACATDILGNLHGSYNNIKTVYANIFAGLYHGQLGRPLESFSYIHNASHKLMVLMRPSVDKMRGFKNSQTFPTEAKYNQLALAFWTCLQLESDLIAEMHLPPSGLLSYENDIPHPNMTLLEGIFDKQILDSYLGQLYLRTHLNSIHRTLYASDDQSKKAQDKIVDINVFVEAVSSMAWVAPSFAFREDDAPAGDILAARLRAKYWGAQVITYRPFIRQILHFSHCHRHQSFSPGRTAWTEFRQNVDVPVINPDTRSPGEINPAIIELAQKGIKALIESTRAFHNLGDRRPIITNVFGTAHAQWGNLLVLSACFNDPVLRPYINEELLSNLFYRTIYFLRQSATASSSLATDMRILEGLQRDLFCQDPRVNSSSFSSQTTTVHTPTMPPAGPPMHLSHQTNGVHPGHTLSHPAHSHVAHPR